MSASGYHHSPGPMFDPRPVSRLQDPSTSKEAESHLRASGKLSEGCELTLAALRAYIRRTGQRPTSAELAGGDLKQHRMYHKRLPDLRSLGYVMQAGKRVCSITGRSCMTWAVRP